MPVSSPELVRVLDRIRFQLAEVDSQRSLDLYSEFAWFAREYPRCYRYHLECAEFRLRSIHGLFCQILSDLVRKSARRRSLFSMSISDSRVERIYWDFESFLSEINIALDLVARIVGTSYPRQMPASFNKFCKVEGEGKLFTLMKRAQIRWVRRLKDYRDCFVHYTPVDTLLNVGLYRHRDGFHIRAKLPTNPNVRDILGFRFSRRVELLRYAYTVWRHMVALDRAVASEIDNLYVTGQYPKRTSGLFFLGGRDY
jgi:hypothetical protein